MDYYTNKWLLLELDKFFSLRDMADAYWQARFDAGDDVQSLKYLPWKKDKYDDTSFTRTRIQALQDEIDARGLASVYNAADTKPIPIEITGDRLYFNPHTNDDVSGYGPVPYGLTVPYCFARTPEEARYMVSAEIYVTPIGDYTKQGTGEFAGKAYKTTTKIFIKDCKKGDILWSKTYMGSPPQRTAWSRANEYGRFNQVEAKRDIREQLNKLFPRSK
jgi:hypothetical protein